MSERITAIYQLHTKADPERLAATIAGEQSSGTFVAIPGEDEALKTALEEAVNDYLQECQEKGLPPEKPASGKLLLRLAPELHGQAIVAAKAAGKSLNQWVAEALHRAVQTD